MQLYNASSMFEVENIKRVLKDVDNPLEFKKKLTEAKKQILELYNFKAYNVPDDFTQNSAIIASNHLTDSDAPLIISIYYQLMKEAKNGCPELFVFAKENCFNGVSIPQELLPILRHENIFEVNRNSISGSRESIKTARKWFHEGEQPKHFLIFSQGTIFDINQDKPEDIEKGAFWLARLLGIPVLPTFIEQAVEGEDNRLVFGEPIFVPKECREFDEYIELWLNRVIEAQNQLESLTGKPAREVVLDEDHKTRKRKSLGKD